MIIHEYRTPNMSIYHVDLYRLNEEESTNLEIWELIKYRNSLVLVEWYEHAPKSMFEEYVLVEIDVLSDRERSISIYL